MKHKVTIDVELNEVSSNDFQTWVAEMAKQWRADVNHNLDGQCVQQFASGHATDVMINDCALQQWIAEEYSKINQELAAGWEEVGELLQSKDADNQLTKTKDVA